MWSAGLNPPVTLFSRAGGVLNDKVVVEVHHHDDFSPVLFKDRAGVTLHSSQTGEAKPSLHPGVTNYTGTFTVLIYTVAVLNHPAVGIHVPGVVIQSFHFGQAVSRGRHWNNEL